MTLKADREYRNTLKMKAFSNAGIVPKDKPSKVTTPIMRAEKRAIQTDINTRQGKTRANKKAVKAMRVATRLNQFRLRKQGKLANTDKPCTLSRQLQSPMGNIEGTSRTQDKATAQAIASDQLVRARLNKDMHKAMTSKPSKYYKIGKRGLSRIG